MKLNVDASFHDNRRAGATRAVLRDARGDLIAASTSYLQGIDITVMAEALALSNGLDLAIRMGCNRLMIESDCSEVVEAFNDREQWWSAQTTISLSALIRWRLLGGSRLDISTVRPTKLLMS
jgi:ribonuclease HI